MSIRPNFKVDFSKWAKHPAINQLTQQVTTYEKRVAGLVKDFDLKSREARERSRKQLDKVLVQLKQTRAKVEKRVTQLVQLESKKLNKRVNELVAYVSKISRQEVKVRAAAAGRAKKTTTSRKTTTTRSRKTRSGK